MFLVALLVPVSKGRDNQNQPRLIPTYTSEKDCRVVLEIEQTATETFFLRTGKIAKRRTSSSLFAQVKSKLPLVAGTRGGDISTKVVVVK